MSGDELVSYFTPCISRHSAAVLRQKRECVHCLELIHAAERLKSDVGFRSGAKTRLSLGFGVPKSPSTPPWLWLDLTKRAACA